MNERSCLDIACSGAQGGSIRIVGLYFVPARDSLAAPPRVTAHFSSASTLSAGSSNSFSYLSRSRGYPIRNSRATSSKGLCCKPDVGVSQIRTTTVLSSCFCVGQTVL